MSSNLKLSYPHIPYEAMSVFSTVSLESEKYLNNLSNGPRRTLTSFVSTSSTCWIDYEVADPQAASSLQIIRANLLKDSGVNVVQLRACNSSLRIADEIGGVIAEYDSSREVFVDNLNRVSTWKDVSGNNRHLNQSSLSNKPQWTRADDKENLTLQSQSFDSASWTKGLLTVLANQEYDPYTGKQTADYLKEDSSNASHNLYQSIRFYRNRNYRIRVVAKSTSRNIKVRLLTNTEGYIFINLSSGVVYSTTGIWANVQITALDNGYWLIEGERLHNANDADGQVQIGIVHPSNGESYLGDNTSGLYVAFCQVQDASAEKVYIQTESYQLHKGVNGCPAVFFDGIDDAMDLVMAAQAQPLSIFVVVRSIGQNTTNQYLYDTQSGNSRMYLDSGGTIYFTNGITLSAASARNTTKVYSGIANGASSKLYDNGNLIASGNAGSNSFTNLRVGGENSGYGVAPFAGEILRIIIFSGELSASNRQKVEDMLTTLYVNEPLVAERSLDTLALNGPKEEDLSYNFTETQTYRHWWVQFSAVKPTSYEHSKIFISKPFDFGRDPIWGRKVSLSSNDEWNREPRYVFELKYQDIQDSTTIEFLLRIGNWIDVNPVCLITTIYDEVLNEAKVIHCMIKSYSIEPISYNQSNITIVVEELI